MAQLTNRRSFLKSTGALAGTVFMGGGAIAEEEKREVKNVIFLVADGMGVGTLSLTECWHQTRASQSLEWVQLYTQAGVVVSKQDTASANSMVTDSAAAGSAWGGGKRVNNGVINITPEGEELKPIGVHAKELGMSVGLVTTTRLTHATPAAFLASVQHRKMEEAIADQYLVAEADVYLGGGMKFFRQGERDLITKFEQKGYAFVDNKQSLKLNAGKDKLLGVFSHDHIPYAIDRVHQAFYSGLPNLVEMFEAALQTLEKNPNGFLLQIEGGRIDHAGHANDPGTIVHEQLEFDACIPVAMEYVRKNPGTLLVVTTDHGTAGCQLNGVGNAYRGTGEALAALADQQGSFEFMAEDAQGRGAFSSELFMQVMGWEAWPEIEQEVNDKLGIDKDLLARVYGKHCAGKYLAKTGVGWTSHEHTAELVDLLSYGAGAERFPPYLKNEDVHHILKGLLKRG
ncbi:alkaline phosphatase [Rubritalea spongiae]|uniref:Alkaline phosphatase n=1 Tax=Rubritalea spongiae TaxID=430797 RepID=A0ABW5E2C0_9BACT